MANGIVTTLSHALNPASCFESIIHRLAFESVTSLAQEHLQQKSAGTQKPYFTVVVENFLRFVFDFVLLHEYEHGLLELATECLFVLVCCDVALFYQQLESLVLRQTNQQVLCGPTNQEGMNERKKKEEEEKERKERRRKKRKERKKERRRRR